MKTVIRRILACVLLTACLLASAAPNETIVSLLTAAPGGEVYQLEGHTGLRLRSPRFGDVTVNWGVFDFNSPNFLYRFVKGETDYMCAAWPTEIFLEEYRREGRRVDELVLNLTPEEAERVVRLVEENLQPQNRIYRYNYVYDNCATRPLAIIERAIGDTLTLGVTDHANAGGTFRETMARFHRNYPWYQFGIDTALGQGIDISLSNRNLAFAPVLLDGMLAAAVRPDGRPAVRGHNVLLDSQGEGPVLPPTPWYLTPMTWAVVVMALCAWAAFSQWRADRPTRFSKIVWTLYYGIAGLEGLVLTFLIFVSVHEATSPNWLYLWLNPLCLFAAVGVWLKKFKRLVVYYQIVNFVLLIALAVVAVAGLQTLNTAFIPLILADLCLAASCISEAFRQVK